MSELFLDANILSDIKIGKMMTDYGFAGFGYYCAIAAELYKNGGRLGFADLGIMAKNIGIDNKKLRNFINNCIEKYVVNGQGIFSSDEDYFWIDDLIKLKTIKKRNKTNGSKGGRPKKDVITERVEIPDIEFVNLDKEDFEKLKSKFGEELIMQGITILDNWLAKKSAAATIYLGKNHYGHFRKDGWVLSEAQKKLDEKIKHNWGYC